jgi:hypothetical protein
MCKEIVFWADLLYVFKYPVVNKIKESGYNTFYAVNPNGNAAQQHVLERVGNK